MVGGWGWGGEAVVPTAFCCTSGKVRDRVVTQLFPEGGNLGEGEGVGQGGEGGMGGAGRKCASGNIH